MSTEPFLPYGRQSIDQKDIDAVVEVLQSDWLTTGPLVERFEQAVASFIGVPHAVAVSNGTAALHSAMFACGIAPGDEVIVPPLTFAATANSIIYQGGVPVFSDVEPGSLLIDVLQLQEKVSSRTKAIIAVDYAGQPCDYEALRSFCDKHGLYLVVDACHSFGATYKSTPVGQSADLTVFSFHPVKPMTTGEGGMIVSGRADLAKKMRNFRNHGITTDHKQRSDQKSWRYEMIDLGYNYRLTDIQSALGLSQLSKLQNWLKQRAEIAELYKTYLEDIEYVEMLHQYPERQSGWHLLVVRVANGRRDELFQYLRGDNIGANVHYGLVYRHPYYRACLPEPEGSCPIAEQAEREILTLPLFPAMREKDVGRVCTSIREFFIQLDGSPL